MGKTHCLTVSHNCYWDCSSIASVIKNAILIINAVLFIKTMTTFQITFINLFVVRVSLPLLNLKIFLCKYPNTMEMIFKVTTEKDLLRHGEKFIKI